MTGALDHPFNTPATRLLVALVAGLMAGAVANGSGYEADLLAAARPIGRLWLNALTMTVVPLVTALLIAGVFDAGQRGGNAVARRSLGWFAVLLLAASLIGGVVALLLLDAWPIPQGATRLTVAASGEPVSGQGGDWVDAIVPANIVSAAAETAMVPLVLFAMLFGFALTRIDRELAAPLARVFRAIAEVMLVIVGWVLWIGPVGVLALAFGVGVTLGAGAAGVLLHYVLVIIMVCLAVALAMHLFAAVAGRMGLVSLARAALPAQTVAMSTQSSLAALPVMMSAAPAMQVDSARAGIVLPLAVSLFRAASAAANVAVAVYLAQVHGVPVGAITLLVGAVVAAAVSVGAVGLPAQVSFFAVIAPVCIAMGVPVTMLPLLLAIETIPDVFRTLGNVTADVAVLRLLRGSPSDPAGGEASDGTRATEGPGARRA
ncbi:dicarboxylate/amino acid:cation symporter [Erythrobacter donghaensis]|uniref:dicarboxylate/amino acid:cation symporter n=1 Tax=Erythrobacter donghaensis TaxID=267135 RepID=UPI00093EEA43|nr:cation:dicarboxylase symporter family transporter [Erythrobacter donghaensis]